MSGFSESYLHDLREQFPVLNQTVRGRELVYLDNAATTQKSWAVLREMQRYYQHDNANVNRSAHTLSHRTTEAFELTRSKLAKWIGANRPEEVVFTKGCTEAINLVASSWGAANLGPGDEILLTTMEHHANIVPWQLIACNTGAIVRPIPINPSGEVDLEAFSSMLSTKVKMVGVVHISNSLGTRNPVEFMISEAHRVGARVLVDGAQGLAHERPDVQAWDVDFYTMSAHKAYGPTGVGALYGKYDLLSQMPPYQGGGDMIRKVSFEGSTYQEPPHRFEAGTPNMAGVIGWGSALDFLSGLEWDLVHAHEDDLVEYAIEQLDRVPGVRVVGRAAQRKAVVSFVIDRVHPHDIGTILDQQGIAIRTGHHCCMPLMKHLGLPGTARASFAIYNVRAEVDRLVQGLDRVLELFG
ncbi:MAG: cysteine desulfurase [Armatimonadetes bacterium]|nr:cysteine desulfurase [Armatimonadota bacterium]